MWETEFHAHTKQQKKICSSILIFVFKDVTGKQKILDWMVPGILQVESAPDVFCMQFCSLVSFPNILTSPLFQRI